MADEVSSLLSKGQREFLRGQKEAKNRNQERVTYSRIRRRLQQGITDFDLLWKNAGAIDTGQMFEYDLVPNGSAEAQTEQQELHDGLVGMIALLYGGFKESGLNAQHFETLLEKGIREAEGYYPDHPGTAMEMTTVNVEIDINRYTGTEEAVEQLLGQEYSLNGGQEEAERVFDELVQEGILSREESETDSK